MAENPTALTPPSPLQQKILKHVASMVKTGSSVLDVGCGDGHLLNLLASERGVRARGLEISRSGVSMCVARGLSVVQGDANTDLVDYPDKAFDYVVLTQTIQAMDRPLDILNQSLRIGNYVIVSTPNFAHWKLRLDLLLNGRMPRSRSLPSHWYHTDNIHLCTLTDFIDLCNDNDIKIEKSYAGRPGQVPSAFSPSGLSQSFANWRAREAIFLLRRN